MSVFSNRLKNKVSQLTYRPRKKGFSPKGAVESLAKAINDGAEEFFIEKEANAEEKKETKEETKEEK